MRLIVCVSQLIHDKILSSSSQVCKDGSVVLIAVLLRSEARTPQISLA